MIGLLNSKKNDVGTPINLRNTDILKIFWNNQLAHKDYFFDSEPLCLTILASM